MAYKILQCCEYGKSGEKIIGRSARDAWLDADALIWSRNVIGRLCDT